MSANLKLATDLHEMHCSKCNASAFAHCGHGPKYLVAGPPVSKSQFAERLFENPAAHEKSTRAIQAELEGQNIKIDTKLLEKARKKQLETFSAVGKRIGKDGKKRASPKNKEAPTKGIRKPGVRQQAYYLNALAQTEMTIDKMIGVLPSMALMPADKKRTIVERIGSVEAGLKVLKKGLVK